MTWSLPHSKSSSLMGAGTRSCRKGSSNVTPCRVSGTVFSHEVCTQAVPAHRWRERSSSARRVEAVCRLRFPEWTETGGLGMVARCRVSPASFMEREIEFLQNYFRPATSSRPSLWRRGTRVSLYGDRDVGNSRLCVFTYLANITGLPSRLPVAKPPGISSLRVGGRC